jgi:hypothetical protein
LALERLAMVRGPEPELANTIARLQAVRQAKLRHLLAAAVERGELAKEADLALMLDMLGGLLHVRLFVRGGQVDELVIARAVDVLLHGVIETPVKTRRRAR